MTKNAENSNNAQTPSLNIADVRRSIFEFFTPDEIGLFQYLVKQYSKSEKWDDYKQNKLDKLEGKLKQLRSF